MSDQRGMVEDETAHPQQLLNGTIMNCVGKKAAGRELDGRVWDQYPAVTPNAPTTRT